MPIASGSSSGRTRARKALELAGAALAGTLFGAVLLVLLMTRFLGYHVLTVQSGSMSPTLQRGDLVVTRPEPITSATVGDVVLFDEGEQVHLAVIHRVASYINLNVNITDSRTGKITHSHTRLLTTKGDANPQPDSQAVDQSRFLGTMWFTLPGVGSVLSNGIVRAILIAAVALSVVALLANEVVQLRRRRRLAEGEPK